MAGCISIQKCFLTKTQVYFTKTAIHWTEALYRRAPLQKGALLRKSIPYMFIKKRKGITGNSTSGYSDGLLEMGPKVEDIC